MHWVPSLQKCRALSPNHLRLLVAQLNTIGIMPGQVTIPKQALIRTVSLPFLLGHVVRLVVEATVFAQACRFKVQALNEWFICATCHVHMCGPGIIPLYMITSTLAVHTEYLRLWSL